jgi:helix-turn-helix protein
VPSKPKNPPLSEAHLALGQYLRTLRKYAGYTTRQMPYSSSTISDVENGLKPTVSRDVLNTYVPFCQGEPEREEELERLYWAMIQAYIKLKDRRKNVEQTAQRRKAMLDDLRRVMDTIRAEVQDFSRPTVSAYEALDARLVDRLAEEDEQLKNRLKRAGIPKDWRENLWG